MERGGAFLGGRVWEIREPLKRRVGKDKAGGDWVLYNCALLKLQCVNILYGGGGIWLKTTEEASNVKGYHRVQDETRR